MGLFEDTVVKAKDAFDIAAKKTNEVISLQKLKIKASQVNSQMSKDFETLGRLYYEAVQESGEIADQYKEIVSSIDEQFAQLADIETQIDMQKKNRVCSNCNTKNGEDAVYCTKCGEKL